MMNHSFSMLSFLLMMTVTILFEGALSVEARTMNRSDSLNSDFIEGNEHRRKSRGLATSTMSKDTVSDTDADDESTLTATDKKLPSAKKGSIASRTGSVVTTKETSFSDPESMGIHFVKPETVAPSVAPNPMTTSSPSIAPNSTSTSSSAPATKKRTSPPVPARTSYPTAKNVESIASRSSTMEVSTRTPLSSNMEFDMAKIVSPSTLRPTSSTTSASSVDSDTVGEFRKSQSYNNVSFWIDFASLYWRERVAIKHSIYRIFY